MIPDFTCLMLFEVLLNVNPPHTLEVVHLARSKGEMRGKS